VCVDAQMCVCLCVCVCLYVCECLCADEELSVFGHCGDTTIYRVFECAVFLLKNHTKKCFCSIKSHAFGPKKGNMMNK
jgi:hypothetical protein